MKQEEKLTQLIQTWDNKEKAQAIKILKSSMMITSMLLRRLETHFTSIS